MAINQKQVDKEIDKLYPITKPHECTEICEDEEDDNCDCESCHRAEMLKLRGF